MKMTIDCVKCVLDNVFNLAKENIHDVVQREALVRELLEIAGQVSWAVSPPEYAAKLYSVIDKHSGGKDFFKNIKEQSTAKALEMLPRLRELAENSEDPFAAKVKLAIAGNIIDYGVKPDYCLDSTMEEVLAVLRQPVADKVMQDFRQAVENAESILYILDNCGEAVLDSLLLETMKDKVTLGVRGYHIFNDMTPEDIVPSGLGDYPFVDTGDSTPGVSLCDSSDAFRDILKKSDLIIAKGQGNFETLTDYPRSIYFLFRAKCPVVRKFLGGAEKDSIQIIGRNADK